MYIVLAVIRSDAMMYKPIFCDAQNNLGQDSFLSQWVFVPKSINDQGTSELSGQPDKLLGVVINLRWLASN